MMSPKLGLSCGWRQQEAIRSRRVGCMLSERGNWAWPQPTAPTTCMKGLLLNHQTSNGRLFHLCCIFESVLTTTCQVMLTHEQHQHCLQWVLALNLRCFEADCCTHIAMRLTCLQTVTLYIRIINMHNHDMHYLPIRWCHKALIPPFHHSTHKFRNEPQTTQQSRHFCH